MIKPSPDPTAVNVVILQPVAMVTPTIECIYAPSRLRQQKEIPYQEFVSKYADHGLSIQVSFEPDGKSNPQTMTAYGFGCDCWYLAF